MSTVAAPGRLTWEGKSTAGVDSTFLGNLENALRAVGATAVRVTSARRTPATNPGVSNSNHLTGHAIDGEALINGAWVPIGTAIKSVASQFGLRSGDTPGFWSGASTADKSDPIHVDDGFNVGGVTTAVAGAANSLNSFFSTVLAIIGAPITNENLQFLSSWAGGRENTAAQNNPLATTQKSANSFDLPGNAALNNGIAVQQYPTASEGARATAATLVNGHYGHIVQALKTGKPYAYQSAYGASIGPELATWSGSGYTSVPKPDGSGGGGFGVGSVTGAIGDAAGHIPGVDTITGAAGGVADAAGSIAGFFGTITDPHNILRGLQILAGGVMVGGGLFLLAKQVGLVDAAMSVTPVGRAGKAAAGAGGAVSEAELAGEYAKGERQRQLGTARQAGRRGGQLGGNETEASTYRRREQARRDRIRSDADADSGEIPF